MTVRDNRIPQAPPGKEGAALDPAYVGAVA